MRAPLDALYSATALDRTGIGEQPTKLDMKMRRSAVDG